MIFTFQKGIVRVKTVILKSFSSIPSMIYNFGHKFSAILNNFLSNLVGTPQFKHRVRVLIVTQVKHRTSLFKDLRTIPTDTKQSLGIKIRMSEKKLNAANIVFREVKIGIFGLVYWGGFLVYPLVAPFIINIWVNASYDSNNWIFISVITWIGSFFFSGFSLIPFWFAYTILRKIFGQSQLVRPLALMTLVLITIFLFTRLSQLLPDKTLGRIPPSDFLPLSILLGSSLWLGTLLALFLFDWIAEIFYIRWLRNRFPDILVVDTLLTTLSQVENNPKKWTETEFKEELLFYLEDLARLFANHIPKRLRSGDPTTEIWFKNIVKEIAAHCRGLKKWILTPKKDTLSYFTKEVSEALVNTINGDWDKLKRSNPQKLTRSERVSYLLNILRSLIVAILPFLIFEGVQRTSSALDDPSADYVKIGTLIWAVISFMMALDPLFNQKIETLKNVTSLLPFGSQRDNN